MKAARDAGAPGLTAAGAGLITIVRTEPNMDFVGLSSGGSGSVLPGVGPMTVGLDEPKKALGLVGESGVLTGSGSGIGADTAMSDRPEDIRPLDLTFFKQYGRKRTSRSLFCSPLGSCKPGSNNFLLKINQVSNSVELCPRSNASAGYIPLPAASAQPPHPCLPLLGYS
jgi:hypothetical protein